MAERNGKPEFEAEPHTHIDKSFRIKGPEDFDMYVDYDDVNHDVIDAILPLVLTALNSIPKHEIEKAVEQGDAMMRKRFEEETGEPWDS